MPERIPRERIKAEDFAAARGKNRPILQEDVNKIEAFEMGRPHLLTCGAIERDDRSLDADEQ